MKEINSQKMYNQLTTIDNTRIPCKVDSYLCNHLYYPIGNKLLLLRHVLDHVTF